MTMTLTDWIKREGLTHEKAAVRIGCSRSVLSRILPGDDGAPAKRKPSWKLLPKILAATGGEVTANDFMDVIPTREPPVGNAIVSGDPSRG